MLIQCAVRIARDKGCFVQEGVETILIADFKRQPLILPVSFRASDTDGFAEAHVDGRKVATWLAH